MSNIKKKKNDNVCIYIEPYTHVNIKGNDCLLYNTLTGDYLVYNNRNDITKLLKRMTSKDNLNALIESKDLPAEPGMAIFLAEAGKRNLIRWYDYEKSDKNLRKPVSPPSLLNLHRDRKKMLLDKERNTGRDIKQALNKINLYINNYTSKENGTNVFTQGYKQFPHPLWAKDYRELPLEDIKRLLEGLTEIAAFKLSVLGGDILQHTQWRELTAYLAPLKMKKEFFLYYREVTETSLRKINGDTANTALRLVVEPGFQKDKLLACREITAKSSMETTFQFTIINEKDAEKVVEIMEMPGFGNISVKPFYDGTNLDFFRENVFVTPADFSESVVSKKEIHARSVMNTNNYGEITVLNTGAVHADVTEKQLGTVAEAVESYLPAELLRSNGWFRVRKHAPPCKGCVFNHVCPPLSGYEKAMGRNNLCTIKE